MSKTAFLVVFAAFCGACGGSTSADFDRWTFYEEMYSPCISFCEICADLKERGCISEFTSVLECIDDLWDMGFTVRACEGISDVGNECHLISDYTKAYCRGEKL